jgi:hypothetical protein
MQGFVQGLNRVLGAPCKAVQDLQGFESLYA